MKIEDFELYDKNMTDKDKVDMLVDHYIKSLDLPDIEKNFNIDNWALRYMISEIVKGFIYPILDSGDLKFTK